MGRRGRPAIKKVRDVLPANGSSDSEPSLQIHQQAKKSTDFCAPDQNLHEEEPIFVSVVASRIHQDEDEGEEGDHDEDGHGEDGTQAAALPDASTGKLLKEGFYEVEAIRKRRTVKGEAQYFIKWKGWPESSNTWEPVDNLSECLDLVEDFDKRRTSTGKRKRGGSNAGNRKRKLSSVSGSETHSGDTLGPCKNFTEVTVNGSPAAEAAETLLNFPGEVDKAPTDGEDKMLDSAEKMLESGEKMVETFEKELESGEKMFENSNKLETGGTNEDNMVEEGGKPSNEKDSNMEICEENEDTPVTTLTKSLTELNGNLTNLTVEKHVTDVADGNETVPESSGKRCTGAKKRKAGTVRRVKQETTKAENANANANANVNANVFEEVKKTPDGGFSIRASAMSGTMSEKLQLQEYRSVFPGSDITKKAFSSPERVQKMSIQKSTSTSVPLVKIIKPISYSSSIKNDKQEVLVLFSTLRSDGKEIVVDNKFLKEHYPLLLIEFYEQHMRYTIK